MQRSLIFVMGVCLLSLLLWRPFLAFFELNPGWNSALLLVVMGGVGHALYRIHLFARDIYWLCAYAEGNARTKPHFLKPLEALLATRSFLPARIESTLDGISVNLGTVRAHGRYVAMTPLFLGIVGALWGLAHLVPVLVEALGHLPPEVQEWTTVKEGLGKPMMLLAGVLSVASMGILAFMTLSFLDLQAAEAGHRFLVTIEDWLQRAREDLQTGLETAEEDLHLGYAEETLVCLRSILKVLQKGAGKKK